MIFLHCADLHLGKSRDFPDYLERQSLMLDGIFQTAKDKTDGLVLIAGDVYDCPVLRPREKDLFVEKLCQADRDGITTVVMNGNHDLIDQVGAGYTHLHTIKDMVDSRRLRNTVCVEFEPAGLYLERFKVCIVAVPALYRKSKEVNAIVASLTRKLQKQYGDDIPIIATIHETIIGAVDETGRPFQKGVRLDGSVPVSYFALGDIHACQQISGIPNAHYSGCPIQHDFSDSSRRGVLLVNMESPEEPEFFPLYQTVKKLETITLVKDQDTSKVDIPLNSIVRIEATKQQLSEMYLPDNVVRTKIVHAVSQPSTIKPVGLDDMFDGLVEILAEMGQDQDGQDFCLDLVRKLQ